MPKTKIDGWQCESCGNTWLPRKKRSVNVCPECNHPEAI